MIDLLNNTNCVLGQESDCDFKGYNLNNLNNLNNINNLNMGFSQLLNDTSKLSWIQPNVFGDNTYNTNGYYDNAGNIKLTDKFTPSIKDILASLN